MIERKIIVLDDDPTGTQTVHDVPVYTTWDRNTFEDGFSQECPMFFVLTNSRSFNKEKTASIHKEIAQNIKQVASAVGKEFMLISRSDSTLRGHFPLETQVLCTNIGQRIDGEWIVPFFSEGKRYTKNNIHYVVYQEQWIPAGESEFAKDKTFGYKSSHLGEWVEEKTQGRYRKEDCIYLLESDSDETLLNKIMAAENFVKVVVNACDYRRLQEVCNVLEMALLKGKRFFYRTASSFPKLIGHITDIPFLQRKDVMEETNKGGIVLIGSHVNMTTKQFESLKSNCTKAEFLEFNQHRVLEQGGLEDEVQRVVTLSEKAICDGKTAVVYTRRNRLDLPDENEEAQLSMAVKISNAVTSVIGNLSIRPSFIIAKGGITSSDIATKALKIKKAKVLGQIAPGIPVWKCGCESKFPDMPYIIFPGNVGEDNTLRDIVDELIEVHPNIGPALELKIEGLRCTRILDQP